MDCKTYLNLQIHRNSEENSLFISQSHYVEKTLERFSMIDCKPAPTPEEVGAVNLSDSPKLPSGTPFKELVGSLLYLVTCTRPDLAHAVSVASRTAEPTEAHWRALKRILRYTKGTKDMGIGFRWEKFPKLIGYSDADHANDLATRRSTTGYCIMFCGGPIAWRCQKQSIVTLSTTEAEYVSGCDLVKDLLPIRELLLELHQIKPEPTLVLIDNQSTVKIANNEKGQQRTKHIDIREKWLTEQSDKNKIQVQHCSSDKQLADIFTKPLCKNKFADNRSMLMTSLLLLSLITIVSSYHFTRVKPVYFKPSNMPYFAGDTLFTLKLSIMNPCRAFFQDITGYEKADHLVESLILDCSRSFNNKVVSSMQNCRDPEAKESELTDFMSSVISRRHKRVPVLIPIVVVFTLLIRATAISIKQSSTNAENIEKVKKFAEQERQVLDEGLLLFKELKNSIHEIQQWSENIDSRVRKAKAYPGIQSKVAGYVDAYEKMFDQQRQWIIDLDQAFQRKRVSTSLQTLSNETLWQEPAADWSTLRSCSQRSDDESLQFKLLFSMPKTSPEIVIMDSVAFNFYNASEPNSVCWMTYKGPTKVLANTTSNCLSEVYDHMIENGAVRSQLCVAHEDLMKINTEKLWLKDNCLANATRDERRVQDREYKGLHRIYCYPFNITIENQTHYCPDHPFELEGKTTYSVANLEHQGGTFNKEITQTSKIHINREILSLLKVEDTKIKAINLTNLNNVFTNYVTKLKELPKTIELKKLEGWLWSPFEWMRGFWSWIESCIETIGIILAVAVGVFLLIIAAPVIELIFIGFGALKGFYRLYLSIVRKVIAKCQRSKKDLKTLKKRNTGMMLRRLYEMDTGFTTKAYM